MRINILTLNRLIKEEINTMLLEYTDPVSLGDIPPLDVPSREETIATVRGQLSQPEKPRKSRKAQKKAYYRTLARMEERGTIKSWQQEKLDAHRAKLTVAATKKSPYSLPPGIDPSMVPGLPGSPEGRLTAAGSEVPYDDREVDIATGRAKRSWPKAKASPGPASWETAIKEEVRTVLHEIVGSTLAGGAALAAGLGAEKAVSDPGIRAAVDMATGGKVSKAEKRTGISKMEAELLDYTLAMKEEIGVLKEEIKKLQYDVRTHAQLIRIIDKQSRASDVV